MSVTGVPIRDGFLLLKYSRLSFEQEVYVTGPMHKTMSNNAIIEYVYTKLVTNIRDSFHF